VRDSIQRRVLKSENLKRAYIAVRVATGAGIEQLTDARAWRRRRATGRYRTGQVCMRAAHFWTLRTWQFACPPVPASSSSRCARSAPWSRRRPLTMTSQRVSASARWKGSTLQMRSYLRRRDALATCSSVCQQGGKAQYLELGRCHRNVARMYCSAMSNAKSGGKFGRANSVRERGRALLDVADGEVDAVRRLVLRHRRKVRWRVVQRLKAVAALDLAQEVDGLRKEVQRVDKDDLDCTAASSVSVAAAFKISSVQKTFGMLGCAFKRRVRKGGSNARTRRHARLRV
jgi:hypothetical protein